MIIGIDFETDIHTAIIKIIQDELGNDSPIQIQGDDKNIVAQFTDGAGNDPTEEQSAKIKSNIETMIAARSMIATVSNVESSITIEPVIIEQVEK